jgi:hypothetical protein
MRPAHQRRCGNRRAGMRAESLIVGPVESWKSDPEKIAAKQIDGRGVEGRQSEDEPRSVGSFELKTAIIDGLRR